MIQSQTQQFLLKLAHRTLKYYFETKSKLEIDENELSEAVLKEKRGVFVTLQKHGQLRGCIGYIEPIQILYKGVIDNALAAAFDDVRFQPIDKEELKEIDIEISILTQPEKIEFNSSGELLKKLEPLKHGVTIKKGPRSATYLPQVWEGLSDKGEFLSSLCKKAGLSPYEWRDGKVEVEIYQAEVFNENSFKPKESHKI